MTGSDSVTADTANEMEDSGLTPSSSDTDSVQPTPCEFPTQPNARIRGTTPLGEVQARWAFVGVASGECAGFIITFIDDLTSLMTASMAGELFFNPEHGVRIEMWRFGSDQWRGRVRHYADDGTQAVESEQFNVDLDWGEDPERDPWRVTFSLGDEDWDIELHSDATARCETFDIACP